MNDDLDTIQTGLLVIGVALVCSVGLFFAIDYFKGYLP